MCEREPSSAAAAAENAAASSSSSADRQPVDLQLDICYSDMIASTTPGHLRHRSSWPEEALAEHLTDMRSC